MRRGKMILTRVLRCQRRTGHYPRRMVTTAGKGEYDEQGNLIVTTYLGMDGKPMSSLMAMRRLRMAYDRHDKVIRRSIYGVNENRSYPRQWLPRL